MENDLYLSDNILNGFEAFEYTLDGMTYPKLYHHLYNLIPKADIKFDFFNRETLIACEIICAAICHKINWDFLRKAIYEKTIKQPEWIEPFNLATITVDEVFDILSEYEKKDRIMEQERCELLWDIGNSIMKFPGGYEEIFFEDSSKYLKDFNKICAFFKKCDVFVSDPQQKKLQLLFQSLSDYEEYKYLAKFYRPTIDYHLIRLFLRRGVVKPVTQLALEYVFNNEATRRENTIATLRKVCADSLDTLSWLTSLDLKDVNRIEWWIGRTICINGTPDCDLKSKESEWLKPYFAKCPYYECCYARQCDHKFLEISEPTYKGTSY